MKRRGRKCSAAGSGEIAVPSRSAEHSSLSPLFSSSPRSLSFPLHGFRYAFPSLPPRPLLNTMIFPSALSPLFARGCC